MSAFEVPGYSPAADVLAAEKAVIGYAVTSAERLDELAALRPQAFHVPQHGLIFAAAKSLASRGEPVNPIAVLGELIHDGDLANAGGGDYLHECFAAAPVSAAWHARRVLEDSRRRGLHERSVSLAALTAGASFDPETGFEQARKLIEDATSFPSETGMRPMHDLVTSVLDSLEHDAERGLSTGIRDLDDVLNGMAAGQLILIAARPSVGKSLLAGGMAMHVAVNLGLPALLVSLEMSAEEITLRLISSLARVPLHSLVKHDLSEDDWQRIAKYSGALADSPLVIDDTPALSVGAVRSRLRDMERTQPARLLVVDYLSLLSADRAENRQVAVDVMAQGLKNVAREFGIPVVAAVQVNRGPEARSDKHPLLSDLRESGALEAHADVAILLHRDDMYEQQCPRAGEIDLDVAKNRQGPRCMITAAFQGHYARIVDMSHEWSHLDAAGIAS